MLTGRKLQQYYYGDNNSGTIIADTDQYASNVAVDSNNVNQANANQNAQAAGNGAAATNAVAVDQKNGELLQTFCKYCKALNTSCSFHTGL